MELEQQLEQELEQRALQYEYYRDLLISEPEKVYKDIELKEYELGDICEIQKGISFKAKDYIKEGDPRFNTVEKIPVLKAKDIKNGKVQTKNLVYCDKNQFPNALKVGYGDVAIMNSGGTVGKVGINLTEKTFIPTQHLFKLIHNESICTKKYLYYSLKAKENNIMSLSSSGNFPVITKNSIASIKLQLPSLEIQKDIVEKLDRFTELSIDGELKKELLLRKEQYEYYREFLFEKWCKKD